MVLALPVRNAGVAWSVTNGRLSLFDRLPVSLTSRDHLLSLGYRRRNLVHSVEQSVHGFVKVYIGGIPGGKSDRSSRDFDSEQVVQYPQLV